ncbi:MAG: outer membrane lipoprotein-sorting protein [Gammaproteobacteria bacterium]
MRRARRFDWLLACLLPGLLVTARAAAPDPAAQGLAIAQEAERRDRGWGDERATLEMVLRNRHGQESRRTLEISKLEMDGDGDRSLTIFDTPRDVAGTALLTYSHALTPDDQWLYLPALKRVKRIASANKSGPFVGSEFAYEDLGSNEVEQYDYRWLRDEDLDGRPCFVVEQRPRYPHSGYTRRIVWLDREIYQPLKVEFHDRKDALLKTLTAQGYTEHLGQYWRPAAMAMVNHQTGKSTTLTWREYRFRTGATARDFDRNALKRAR